MNTTESKGDDLTRAIELLSKRLLEERKESGLWEGELSSSAVSTGVASFALAKATPHDSKSISLSRQWLADHINPDGGWGDTINSKSNPSATLLARSSLLLDEAPNPSISKALAKSELWIQNCFGGTSSSHIIEGVKKYYGQDLTFSAPILTICALSPMFGHDLHVWKKIPPLPFELAVLPHNFYHLMRLPVVSYALPALIAVGIVHFKHNPKPNPLIRIIRQAAIPSALKKLTRLTPPHGGFLEAAPLTAFVGTCLWASGYPDHPVVKKALHFMQSTMRSDGSWPIDTNLSHWLTSLAIKALKGSECFSDDLKNELAGQFLAHQFKTRHPFTNAEAGGWGWTHLEGSVPDADDTAGVLIALSMLSSPQMTDTIKSGIHWLLGLINRDGGIPTFCKGWGKLPFDRSCPDISSHALHAFSRWLPHADDALKRKMEKAMKKLVQYLASCRDEDKAWTPLWFGDQNTPKQSNRVYGTATVLINLKEQPYPEVEHLVEPALKWLIEAQNENGAWGGEPNSPSFFETTALAVTALSLYNKKAPKLQEGVDFLIQETIRHNGLPPASPFGLYFALLWYDERLYPLVFGLRALKEFKNRV